jgi:hypothetical protein
MKAIDIEEILFQLAKDWTEKELAIYIYSNYDCSMDDAILATNLIHKIKN